MSLQPGQAPGICVLKPKPNPISLIVARIVREQSDAIAKLAKT